ncbi:MAG: substrate-binding domain-containing protein [Lachnospiraceae bacterium]|nr:substrate-binding domain-containing protein [Lachnospiraceae bacterium]
MKTISRRDFLRGSAAGAATIALSGILGAPAFAEEETEYEATAVTTVGPDDGTHFELWSFVDVHNEFYANMVNEWNELNPDRPIQITFSTYPYSDMHNKLMMSLQAGSGAPDICDIEIGQFPNYSGTDSPLYHLNDALAPYEDSLVTARLDVYSDADGNRIGVPTHVGAAVMYWNAEIFEQYGLDYKSVTTWDEYTELGRQLQEASGGEVYLTSVDTGGVDWLWVAMAEYGEDWTGGIGGDVDVQIESVTKMLTMQQEWLNEGIAMISTDGHVDLEAGFANIMEGKIASFPKAMWYMSRFVNYMPEMEGKYDITTIPVFEEGQINSVGIGGTGTVVTNQCADPELAAEWLAWAKCSAEGEAHIWNDLGFDVCNTELWYDEDFAFDPDNVYNTFFRVEPHSVLQELADNDAIGTIYTTSKSPTLNDYFCTTTLNYVLEDGWDVEDALQDAQDYLDFELEQ